MLYQEEGQARLRRLQVKEAIALAMQGRWREAVAINRSIIDSFPKDSGSHNRLGRAYLELGEFSLAKEAYRQALEIDPYNNIAQKNLWRLALLSDSQVSSEVDVEAVSPRHFIKETGKAGVVDLYRLAPGEILARLVAGDRVYLKLIDTGLIVEDGRGRYLGEIDPRHGPRLVRLMKGGNQYDAAVVSSSDDKVMVLIREVDQHPSLAGLLSFPPRGVREEQPYVSDRMLRREQEQEEEAMMESTGYTIIEGDWAEPLPEEPLAIDEEEE